MSAVWQIDGALISRILEPSLRTLKRFLNCSIPSQIIVHSRHTIRDQSHTSNHLCSIKGCSRTSMKQNRSPSELVINVPSVVVNRLRKVPHSRRRTLNIDMLYAYRSDRPVWSTPNNILPVSRQEWIETTFCTIRTLASDRLDQTDRIEVETIKQQNGLSLSPGPGSDSTGEISYPELRRRMGWSWSSHDGSTYLTLPIESTRYELGNGKSICGSIRNGPWGEREMVFSGPKRTGEVQQ